jgi:hypothetical protein
VFFELNPKYSSVYAGLCDEFMELHGKANSGCLAVQEHINRVIDDFTKLGYLSTVPIHVVE